MPDLGIFTVPLLGAIAVFGVALITGDDISFADVKLPATMQWNGYDSQVVVRALTNELRDINEDALSEATGLSVEQSYIDQSIGDFAEYFGIGKLVDGTRNLLHMNKYYVVCEIKADGDKVLLTALLFTRVGEKPVDVIRVPGDPADLRPMFAQAANRLLVDISPYIVALHDFKTELNAKQWDFPKTRQVLAETIQMPPPEDDYLAYDLIGRMHLRRAQQDESLLADARQAQIGLAIEYLTAALVQNPDFFYSNLGLGVAYAMNRQFELSDLYFAKAVELQPNKLLARENWGRALVRANRLRDAAYQYVAAVEIAPDVAELRNTLADIYVKLGHPEAALGQWEAAHKLDPLNGQAIAHLKEMGARNVQ